MISGKFSMNNDIIHGIYATEYIASWVRNGKDFEGAYREKTSGFRQFQDWLQSIEVNGSKLTKEEIQRIVYLAGNGKLELEESIKHYLRTCCASEEES